MSLLISDLVEKSLSRAKRWYKGEPTWSLLEWAGAMAGEAGEACNKAKKVKRIEEGIDNKVDGLDDKTELSLMCYQTAHEAADTIIYAIHVIVKAGYNPETVIREVFNKKSEEYGFLERI